MRRSMFGDDARFEIRQGSFADLQPIADAAGFDGRVNGVLLDLGVSSPQLDRAERGFSFLNDGPLDMRMDNSAGVSAADWLKVAEADEIAQVFKTYGEERFARRIARAIVEARVEQLSRRLGAWLKLSRQPIPPGKKASIPQPAVFRPSVYILTGSSMT